MILEAHVESIGIISSPHSLSTSILLLFFFFNLYSHVQMLSDSPKINQKCVQTVKEENYFTKEA